MKKYIILILTLLLLPITLNAKVAVVKARYDRIDNVLKAYRIPFDKLSLEDLENPVKMQKYNSIFFPCGIETPPDKNINVLARGRSIKAVSLKTIKKDPDNEKIAENISAFIKSGGSAYFSGYTFKYAQMAFDSFKFFDNFAYMGMDGRIVAEPGNDLSLFSSEETHELYMSHPGWIALKEAERSETIASGSFNTPRGEKSGPITVILERGKGELLYTSYHSTVFSDFRRFNVYRIAGSSILKKTLHTAGKWEQNISGKIVDALHSYENSRTYRLNLKKGLNTIYFTSEKSTFQVDIFDSTRGIIMSINNKEKDKIIDIYSRKEQRVFFRVVPSGNKRFKTFCIVSAEGRRFFPYWYTTLLVMTGIFSIALFVFLIKTSDKNKYAGRLS